MLDSSSKGTNDILGGTELPGIRMRAGGAAFSQAEVLAEAIVPSLCPPVAEPGRSALLS